MQNQSSIIVSKGHHRGQDVILLKLNKNSNNLFKVKSISTLQYSKTLKSWYLPYTKESWVAFIHLNIPYSTQDPSNQEPNKIDQKSELQHNVDTSIYKTHDRVDVKEVKIDYTNQSGTATSPIDSDIASIATSTSHVTTTVYPTNGDSKDTDIHLIKGGRFCHYNNTNFFITIYYNEADVQFLKSLKGYWQSNIKKWILKGTFDNLEKLQHRYAFWDNSSFDKISELILLTTNPYVVTLYRTPEITDMILVKIAGHKANIQIISRVNNRQYQKEEKRWLIPYDKIIVENLKTEYTRDGATIVDRLPHEGYDYHKKEESYGQFKTRYLAKTETELKPIVERYIDTLIALKRSQRTMTTYLGPFIKFVKDIGIDNVENVNSKDMDKYMAMVGGKKVSDGMLHNTYNAIMFYYREVLRQNETVLKEARRPKKDDRLPTILSIGEVDRILRALDNLKHTTLLYTFYSSGIRLNEILHLRVEDMWWERNQIFIHKGKGSPRWIFKEQFESISQIYFSAT